MPTDNIARHVTNALQHATKRLAEMFQVALIFEYAFIKYWMHARWCRFQVALIFEYAFFATCGLWLVGYQCKCKYALKRIATRKHNPRQRRGEQITHWKRLPEIFSGSLFWSSRNNAPGLFNGATRGGKFIFPACHFAFINNTCPQSVYITVVSNNQAINSSGGAITGFHLKAPVAAIYFC